MKKLIFLLPICALLLSACSNEGNDPEIGPEVSDDVTRSYLSVALYAPASSTRADGGYQDGTISESKVNNVRFFFFKENGDACMVFKQAATGSYLSYIDWTPYDSDINDGGDPDLTVEKIATATLGLNQPNNEGLPSLVLAIVNPTSDILALENPDLDDLTSLVNDYYTGLHDSNFLITNSVYVNSDGIAITATPTSQENFGDPLVENSVESMQTLNIFVERVLARLDFSLNLDEDTNPVTYLDDGTPIYKVSSQSINGQTATPVYAKLLGWNITATSKKSRAIKLINPNWDDDIFGGVLNPWNTPQFCRSFWAINPPPINSQEPFYSYGDFDNATSQDIPEDEPVTVYLQENAADYSGSLSYEGPKTPTCVIIGAELVYENGETAKLARWANRYYTQDNLLTEIANVLNLYQKTENPNGDIVFDQITPDCLEFVSSENITLPEGETKESYYAYVQLNKKGEQIDWYGSKSLNATPLGKDATNNYIINRVNYVLVWNNGLTYYYFDIRHLGVEDGKTGYYGVVRNHLYQTNLTGIAGLGTPVFDPDQVIYPTKPSQDDHILQVQVNVLQWKIVTQDYVVSWP